MTTGLRGSKKLDNLAIAKWLYSIRRLRPGSQVRGLYSDPAWDILLDLYIRQKLRLKTSITAAGLATEAPPTTALRYITLLCSQNLIQREPDTKDGRRHWLTLSPETAADLDTYMTSVMAALSSSVADTGTEVDLAGIAEAVRAASNLMRTVEGTLERLEWNLRGRQRRSDGHKRENYEAA
jgi:DNA-binding MarR family transcriptional regulator